MTVDVSDLNDTVALKNKWVGRGVPEALFDAMVNEANAEYNTVLGVTDFSRFSILTVNLVDNDETTECFYRVILNWGGYVLMGQGIDALSFMFGQVPSTEIHIEVFKITNDGTECKAYGSLLFVHSKDEECTVTLETTGAELIAPNASIGSVAVTWIAQEMTPKTMNASATIAVNDIQTKTLTLTASASVTVT